MENKELAAESSAAAENAAQGAVQKKKGGKKKWIIAALIVLVVLITLLRVLGGGGSGKGNLSQNYHLQEAKYDDLVVSVSGSGTLEAIHTGTIVGMVAGDILSDTFEIGDSVEKDQVLYVIDAENAQTGVEQAQLAVQQAQLSYDQALRTAEDLTVKSTASGQISELHVKRGDSVSAGMAVATVTDNQNMTIKCDFNAADAKNIVAGQSGTVTITATGESVAATVKNVSGYTTVGTGGTLVQSVELTVKNPGGITGGMAATAQVGTYACQSGGTFDYATRTQIYAKAGGTVDALYVSEGTAVADGTKLLHLDSPSMEDQVESAALSVENARLSLRTAQDALDSYQIKAPISGTVTQKDFSAGDNIGQAGTSVMAVISDLSALTFTMNIDELDISKVKQGQTVEITVDALDGRQFSGYVDTININGTTSNGVTTYQVTVMVEDADEDLLPGMNVSADIIVERQEHMLMIPLSAVNRGNIVRVVPAAAVSEKDGSIDLTQAQEVEVTLGYNDSDSVVVESGVSEGDLILVEGLWVDQPSGMETRNEIVSEVTGGMTP